ncbi:MAG: hypothetical protein E7211_21225 [Clostridium lundense]|jgi:hypothetical protein|nr:hypothetical protein [Clostridium lundense]
MAENKGTFFVPCVEHEGDMLHFEQLIRNNGGEIVKVEWDGTEDDDAYIIFKAPTQQQVDNIKTILENG